jgi:hypothetical protein
MGGAWSTRAIAFPIITSIKEYDDGRFREECDDA